MIVMEGRELVLHFHEGGTTYCVLTFSARDQTHLAKKTFFGESVFKKYNISAIGLTTTVDNWFINDEMDLFISKIKEISNKYDKIIAIGPSMGAYPAIKYSKYLNIYRILALAPKWTIDPNLIEIQEPELRKHLLSGNMDDIFQRVYDDTKKGQCIDAKDANDNVIICYDPYNGLDKYNVIKLRSLFSFKEVIFPHCGHVVLDQLYGSENLKNIVHSMICDDIQHSCATIAKVRRNHKNRVVKYINLASEKHPYYCYIMIKKFIQSKNSGYKDLLSRQDLFSIIMDRLVRRKMYSAPKEVELFFRNCWISLITDNNNLSVAVEYKKDIFHVVDFHGARLEYSLQEKNLTGSNYFFGSKDFSVRVFAKKLKDNIVLITYLDGKLFYLYFSNGKILLSNFSDKHELLTLFPIEPERREDLFYNNHYMNNIFRMKTSHGYAMSSPGGTVIFNSKNEMTWESFSLHACVVQEGNVPISALGRVDDNKIKVHNNENKKKKSGFLSRFIG